MRVAQIRRRFSALSETFVYDYLCGTAARGLDVHMVCEKRVNESTRPFAQVHVARHLPALHPRRLWLDLCDLVAPEPHGELRRHIAAFDEELVRLRPDVVHAHFGHEAVLAASFCSRTATPLVMSHHGVDISARLRDAAWLGTYHDLWALAAGITVVSEFQRARLYSLGIPRERVHLVRVGKSPSTYPYSPRTGRVRRLVTVGRLCEKKGHDDALRALAQVNARCSTGERLRLDIIGNGPLQLDLERLAADLGVADDLRFLGSMDHSAVIAELQAADAFLLCSKTAPDGDEEGVPTVLMEAQALGLACVSTQHTGIPEVIPEPDRDLLAPEGDPDAVARCITRLQGLTEGERRARCDRGRAHIEEHFNLEREVGRLVDLYSSVASGNRSHAA